MNCCDWHRSGGSKLMACSDRNAQAIVAVNVAQTQGPPIGVPRTDGGPFPGPDAFALQAEVDRLNAELDVVRVGLAQVHSARDRLKSEVEALQAAADASPRVDCICPGCPRKVPQAWVAGMCSPCCEEDCEHTDGARAVAAERDGLAKALDEATAATMAQTQRALAAEQEAEQLRSQTAAAVAEVNRVARETAVFHEMRRLVLLHGDEERKRRNHEFDEQLAGLVEGGG